LLGVKALLVWPRFPRSYWGQEYTLAIIGKRAVVPPLGLLTVAALLPSSWDLRLVDLNVAELEERDLAWADVVMVSGMRVQRASFHEVIARARAAGKRIVAGGPYASTSPEEVNDVDHLVIGEAEDVLPSLARALEEGADAPRRLQASGRPDVSRTPIPRFDLLQIERYDSFSVQFSRGCPFNCEFCDIIEIFGRVPRTKSPEQLIAELDTIRATGFRGPVFLVDDNFIGNKVAAKKMLRRLAVWSEAHEFPFDLFTEASVNLADDDVLIQGMVAAGFSAVFLGIETPSREALLETQKRQNTHLDLQAAVEKLVRAGLEVMAGFIVGFDADDQTIFERQREFISQSPISMAMVGLLTALPSTQLWRRLAAEGRLLHEGEGDAAYHPNFVTRLPAAELVSGYGRLLASLYEPRAYFRRALRALELQRDLPAPRYRRRLRFTVAAVARSLWKQGVLSSYRSAYWAFLARALRTAPRRVARAMALAIHAEHFIRYTFEDVLPRLSEPPPPQAMLAAAPLVQISPRGRSGHGVHLGRARGGATAEPT
jgi:radical SAM superfamily enzyme YgiQ (UPF0313 family)